MNRSHSAEPERVRLLLKTFASYENFLSVLASYEVMPIILTAAPRGANSGRFAQTVYLFLCFASAAALSIPICIWGLFKYARRSSFSSTFPFILKGNVIVLARTLVHRKMTEDALGNAETKPLEIELSLCQKTKGAASFLRILCVDAKPLALLVFSFRYSVREMARILVVFVRNAFLSVLVRQGFQLALESCPEARTLCVLEGGYPSAACRSAAQHRSGITTLFIQHGFFGFWFVPDRFDAWSFLTRLDRAHVERLLDEPVMNAISRFELPERDLSVAHADVTHGSVLLAMEYAHIRLSEETLSKTYGAVVDAAGALELVVYLRPHPRDKGVWWHSLLERGARLDPYAKASIAHSVSENGVSVLFTIFSTALLESLEEKVPCALLYVPSVTDWVPYDVDLLGFGIRSPVDLRTLLTRIKTSTRSAKPAG